jgi:hypothetical protein
MKTKPKKKSAHFSKMGFDSKLQAARIEFMAQPDMGAL